MTKKTPTDFDEVVQAGFDAYEYNKPKIGGLYFYAHNNEEMALIVCDIIDDNVELPLAKKLDSNYDFQTVGPRKAYELTVLINIPRLEKCKYQRIVMSHDRWHEHVERKA